ncbi:hypothetical protein EB796_003266 [Bugula neritina]|uniref:Uncharacterized protein n=1 Tax=Bugula neritina TaxID=10212 RepID=A0A7J7KIB7_BUGNE|nr:hypothetical protein EB796_003266 [Bugula neritina]
MATDKFRDGFFCKGTNYKVGYKSQPIDVQRAVNICNVDERGPEVYALTASETETRELRPTAKRQDVQSQNLEDTLRT